MIQFLMHEKEFVEMNQFEYFLFYFGRMASNETGSVLSVGEENNLTPHASNISSNYFKFLEEALVTAKINPKDIDLSFE